MYDRILVAIDFSEPSVEALRWAARHFPGAEITLLHSVEELKPPGYLRRAVSGELDLQLEKELDVRANLEHLAEETGLEASVLVGKGWPPREVNRAAKGVEAELIVVGAHTRRIWPWDEPGAMATKIVEEADIPVLVWRPTPRQADPEDRTVLAALDLREGSEPVGETAARVAAHFDARLVLIHVLPRALQAYLRAVSTARKAETTLQQIDAVARQEALAQVPEGLAEELPLQAMVFRGRPVTQILAIAESESANLIVMGQSHITRIHERAFLGDVTGKVLRGASCSVLVLPLTRGRS